MNIVESFYFFVDDFEVFDFLDGPRGPERRVLGAPGGVRRGSGRRLGKVLGGLGGPGGVRGCPGGVLGGSWAVLELSWSDMLSSSISDRFVDGF